MSCTPRAAASRTHCSMPASTAQDRVGFIGKNIPEYFTLSYGAAKLNAVPVAVNWRLAPPEMAFILDNAEAKVVLVEGEFLGHLDKMELPRNPLIIEVGGDGQRTCRTASGSTANRPTTRTTRPLSTTPASQLYTSGTTGLPKGAELTNRNFEAIIEPISEMIGVTSDSVMLHILPMFHIGGSGVANVGLFNGATNVVHRDVDPGRIFADIPKHKVTASFMVPALLQVLPMIPGASDVDFSSLETIFYGASPITEEALVGSMALLKCPHAQAYGLTETTGVVTWLPPEDHDPGGPRAKLLRSAGKPVDGVEMRIVDDDGNDVPDGEVGEVWVRTAQNMKGYWRNPEATAEVFPEGRDADGLGWFRTGDAGYIEDGYLFIHDRVKDMIVSGRREHLPGRDRERDHGPPRRRRRRRDRHSERSVGRVTARPDRCRPRAPTRRRRRSSPTARSGSPASSCRAAVERIDAIPRNPSGKILKVDLRKPYWEGRDRAVN